jgi:hypothetical protein
LAGVPNFERGERRGILRSGDKAAYGWLPHTDLRGELHL